MKIIVLIFALSALSALAEDKPAKAAAALKLPEHLSVEKQFVGNWICEGTPHAAPMGPGEKFTDRISFNVALGSSWLVYHIDQMKGPMKANADRLDHLGHQRQGARPPGHEHRRLTGGT
jgi:hypothetical protein